MEASQRWGLAAVIALAIGAIAFVCVQYDRFVGLAGIPMLITLALVFAKPMLAPRAAIFGGLAGIALSIGYMVWAGMHGDEIADPHAATRSVQVVLAVCGLVMLTGRAAAMKAGAPAEPAKSD
ncbi:MAG: hypothetical protein JWO36_1133 [Myxococcales bacterium]|nr:hypothetical protein [Myxococcales bacterium]